ncbi:hypothetical protein N7478_008747 [Penicillium angulare]|uniref:uncharacterized protein n=1 Tax=Penicillium angulare TaxID=116970 RepID=UPI0025420A3C|nr:uncharacterized protein N7478_008747 [Penicillium angulare]KAJ5273622.1 hypothetical protein N7478_008747 [Penicillium angulare]
MNPSGETPARWQRWLQDRRSRETLPQLFISSDSHRAFGRAYLSEGEARTKEAIDISTQKLREVFHKRDSWKSKRKGAKSLQRFLAAFSTFIDDYSGIIEILKLVDNHFGAIAYSTLSVLLKMTLQRKYTSTWKNARKYQSSFHKSAYELLKIGLLVILHHCNLAVLSNDISIAITKANQQTELNKIYQLFRPSQVDPFTNKIYTKALQEPSGSPKHYRRFTFDLLLSEPTYVRWKETNKSSLLILKGRTISQRDGHSWLSLSILGLIDNLKPWGPISYFVQTDPWQHCAPPAYLVLTNIIWQLLKSKPEILAKPGIKTDIEEEMQHTRWQAKLPLDPCKVLTRLLSFFPTTYILLDRLDRCSCSFDNLLDILLNVVKEATSVVKIFAIVDEDNAEIENYEDSYDQLEVITLHQSQDRVTS